MVYRFSDPALAIDWPLEITDTSAKDAAHPLVEDGFEALDVSMYWK